MIKVKTIYESDVFKNEWISENNACLDLLCVMMFALMKHTYKELKKIRLKSL